jgi:hypothetical protein
MAPGAIAVALCAVALVCLATSALAQPCIE